MFVILTVAVVSLAIFCVGIGVAGSRNHVARVVPARPAPRRTRRELVRRIPSPSTYVITTAAEREP